MTRATLFIGTKVGLYRSSGFDGGLVRGWDRLAGAPLGIVSLAVSPDFALDRTIIAGTDTGIFISRDAGDTWAAAHIPHSRSMILALCFSPNYLADGIVLAGTLEDGVWLSDTRGESWQARSFGLLDATAFALAISPNFAADETIYAGTDTAVYYSYNGARAWKQLHFPDDAAPVLSLAVSPDFESDHALYAGTEKNGLYRSVDRGQRWEKLDFPAASVNAMVASAKHGLLAATEAGVFLSRDKGDTWARLAGVPDAISLAMKDDVAVAGLVGSGSLDDDRPRRLAPRRHSARQVDSWFHPVSRIRQRWHRFHVRAAGGRLEDGGRGDRLAERQ